MTWVMKNEQKYARWRYILILVTPSLQFAINLKLGTSLLKVHHSHTGCLLILFMHLLIH